MNQKLSNTTLSNLIIEILDKYQSDGLIVTCIDTGSMAEKIGVQLLDQVILINGKKQESYKNTTKPVELTIKRGNQIFKKTIIPKKNNNSIFTINKSFCCCN